MVTTWPNWAAWEPDWSCSGRSTRRWPRFWAALAMTAEGEISSAMLQVRDTAERFVSRVIPDTRAVVRTRPLEALIIGSYVRGLSDRDIESLTEEGGTGPRLQEHRQSDLSRTARPLYGVLQQEPGR